MLPCEFVVECLKYVKAAVGHFCTIGVVQTFKAVFFFNNCHPIVIILNVKELQEVYNSLLADNSVCGQ